jgi:hypothetical protein
MTLESLGNELAKLLADIIHSLVSSKLKNTADRIRGSCLRCDRPLAIAELGSSGEDVVALLAVLNENGAARGVAGVRPHRSGCEARRPSHRSAAFPNHRLQLYANKNFRERPRQSSAEDVIHPAEGTIARLHQILGGQS